MSCLEMSSRMSIDILRTLQMLCSSKYLDETKDSTRSMLPIAYRSMRSEVEGTVGAIDQPERHVLIRCGMKLAGEIVVETVEREKHRIGKKSANAFFTGTSDGGGGDVENVESNIVNDADWNCIYSDECQLGQGED